eukprot:UN10547
MLVFIKHFKTEARILHENPRYYLKMNTDTMNPEELYNYINELKYQP